MNHCTKTRLRDQLFCLIISTKLLMTLLLVLRVVFHCTIESYILKVVAEVLLLLVQYYCKFDKK